MGPIKLPFAPKDILPNIVSHRLTFSTTRISFMVDDHPKAMLSSCAVELKFIVSTPRFLPFTLVLGDGSSQMQAGLKKVIRKVKDEEITRRDGASLHQSRLSQMSVALATSSSSSAPEVAAAHHD
ncbi:hypothetical protein INT45_002606 [Circinella minor]|uniref:Uncharacterized protein n=1 Tax=Circinella minor TaxID=1195481 RepID=A0A8H7RKW6_9FUNG|nr:hypothetical protein INT45_002606 [Circinella minor]